MTQVQEGTELGEILARLERWDALLMELEAALPTIRAFVDNPVGNYFKNMRLTRERTAGDSSPSGGGGDTHRRRARQKG